MSLRLEPLGDLVRLASEFSSDTADFLESFQEIG